MNIFHSLTCKFVQDIHNRQSIVKAKHQVGTVTQVYQPIVHMKLVADVPTSEWSYTYCISFLFYVHIML